MPNASPLRPSYHFARSFMAFCRVCDLSSRKSSNLSALAAWYAVSEIMFPESQVLSCFPAAFSTSLTCVFSAGRAPRTGLGVPRPVAPVSPSELAGATGRRTRRPVSFRWGEHLAQVSKCRDLWHPVDGVARAVSPRLPGEVAAGASRAGEAGVPAGGGPGVVGGGLREAAADGVVVEVVDPLADELRIEEVPVVAAAGLPEAEAVAMRDPAEDRRVQCLPPPQDRLGHGSLHGVSEPGEVGAASGKMSRWACSGIRTHASSRTC